ncbi:hypothetical protein, partial [Desulfatiglans anilini]|uniref:hypothetical protein n=1 Tax=Desulfatiglans anilini TaxID=90728 RepID=UPI001ABFFF12
NPGWEAWRLRNRIWFMKRLAFTACTIGSMDRIEKAGAFSPLHGGYAKILRTLTCIYPEMISR